MIALIEEHREQIESLCRQHHVKRLELIGSAARGDFNQGASDLDFLVEFESLGWKHASSRYFGLLHGLEDLFHRRVDLVEPATVRNPYFLQAVTRDRELLYAA